MYIEHNKERKLNFLLALLSFIIITSLIKFNSLTIVILNSLLPIKLISFRYFLILNQLFSVLSNPALCTLYVLIMWFFLWGFKHKLIGTWLLLTYFSGKIVFSIIHLIVHQTLFINSLPTNLGVTFPSKPAFLVILIDYCIYSSILPLQKNKKYYLLIKIFIWLLTALILLSHMQLHQSSPTDIVSSFLLAYAWIQLCKDQYLIHFASLNKYKFFRNSDYN